MDKEFTIDTMIKAIGKQQTEVPYLIFTLETAMNMERVGLAYKDEDGRYWTRDTEIKIIDDLKDK